MEDHYSSLALLISPWLPESSLNYTASENGRNSYEDTAFCDIDDVSVPRWFSDPNLSTMADKGHRVLHSHVALILI